LGNQYTPLRKEFWDVPAKPIRDKIEIMMITFGGTDTRNLTSKVLKTMVNNYPMLIKKVIIGKGFRNTTEIKALKNHNAELIYHPDAVKMKEVMLESDVAISAGGQTLYELTRVGVPTIAVAVADNQEDNIKGLQEADCVSYAGWWGDVNILGSISACVEEMKDRALRERRSLTGRRFVDGGGSRRIVDFLLRSISDKTNLSRKGNYHGRY
jgi:spore coat polysaccharide biosynthesis predicted glycosyltransferase SpsG